MRVLTYILLTAFAGTSFAEITLPSLAEDDSALPEYGRELTEQYYAGEYDKIWRRFDKTMRQGLGNKANFKQMSETLKSQLGPESSLIAERHFELNDQYVYTRRAQFGLVTGDATLTWALDQERKINGFWIRPVQETHSDYFDYQTKTSLALPFSGEWTVFWGGRQEHDNYHVIAGDQRFAYDFLITLDGHSFKNKGRKNQDYYCYGKTVLAPADAKVISSIDGVKDNAPGKMNSKQALGNNVVLDHGDGEYSVMAHFREGSVLVKAGDTVKSGDPVAECGNSGNSSEAHLHYHLQNTSEPQKASGLPAQFLDYIAEGDLVKRGEPARGQKIKAASH